MFKKHRGITYLIVILALVFGTILKTEPPTTEAQDPATVDVAVEGLQLTFVDVGQGDAVFLRTIDGETWLFDGGEENMAEIELLPFLDSQGVNELDYAVVSHYHADHIGGILQLLESGRIKTLILPNYNPDNKSKTKLLKRAELSHTTVLEVSAGDMLETCDKDLKLSVLHPQKGGFSSENENSNSMVIRLDYFKTSVLLTGDLETDAEKELIPQYDLEVDILKVGHHGSSSSTGVKFLNATDPTYGVISAGEGNQYGHPHYEVLENLENDDVRIYRTDTDGDITFILNENGIGKISTER